MSSKLTKKPAQTDAQFVKTSGLLPQVFNTEPNQKMLGSTLDAMMSKGQLLPFKETHGIRNASAPSSSFFNTETDPVRRESDSNIALISKTSNDEYLSKVSYLDLENYFGIKGLELKDGVHLDSDVKFLDIPITLRKFTDYQMYHWIEGDLPALRIHANANDDGTQKYSIVSDIIGKPYVTLVDDITGKSVVLQNGLRLYFTGKQDAAYVSDDPETDNAAAPKIFVVQGVGDNIALRFAGSADERVPLAYMKKRPWDKTNPYVDPPAINWDSEVWDGSKLTPFKPEYILMDRFATDNNHWSVFDRWYHINVIRAVAEFLGVKLEELATNDNQAKRPIVSFYKNIRLYNWPTRTISEIKAILPGAVSDYIGKINLTDSVGYVLKNTDRLVFEKTPGIFRISNATTGATFAKVLDAAESDGAIITAASDLKFYKVMFKNGSWIFAQNKTSFNQTPLFDFLKSDGTLLSSIDSIAFNGGVILGFKEGNVYDPVLEKYIEVSEIDFDVVDESNPRVVSPNQIKFVTDIDRTFYSMGEDIDTEVKGPFGYLIGNKKNPFYVNRKGLDATPQLQDFVYTENTDVEWSATMEPAAQGFTRLHVFPDTNSELKFYFEVEGRPLVQFSTRREQVDSLEKFIPFISGGIFELVCHNLPKPLTIFNFALDNNITRSAALTAPLVENNGITNGVIRINLESTYDAGAEYKTNPIAADSTRLFWTYNNIYRPIIVRPKEKWKFIYNGFVLDRTVPIYHDYDFTISNITLPTGDISAQKKIEGTKLLRSKVIDGDKVCMETLLDKPYNKTAPAGLVNNPLNSSIADINYYAMYQHTTSSLSSVSKSRESVDPSQAQTYNTPLLMNSGTIVKHSNPLSKAAIVATAMPFDLNDILIKQGKHYDVFMLRLRSELGLVIDKYDQTQYDTQQLLSLAFESMYINQKDNNTFWYHSNMAGWGTTYNKVTHTVNSTLKLSLTGSLEAISHRAGAETILHILHNGKMLIRGKDYELVSEFSGYYTSIEFNAALQDQEVVVKQWSSEFHSRIPASLAKLGLAPAYLPEIYKDTSYTTDTYFLIRHDGTRYYLESGVENGYPVGYVDALLYEYELAVWSSLSYDVLEQKHTSHFAHMPGGFRSSIHNVTEVSNLTNSEMYAWMQEHNLFLLENSTYDVNDPFTYKYQIGSGDEADTVVGSWRAIYKFLYDTDRPHTHPWEMLGYTIKPTWWETYYSWTDPTKRTALEAALRMGNVAEPPGLDCKTHFARVYDVTEPETFPVDADGNLLPPTSLSWLDLSTSDEFSSVWEPGNMSPYELVFMSTQRGLGAVVAANYLLDPASFVNRNWVPNAVSTDSWGITLSRDTGFWITPEITHSYHREVLSDGSVNFTGGLEALYSEFCVLTNKDFKTTVIDMFNNVVANKEFLLAGFTNKGSIRIQNTSANNQSKSLFVPEENFDVRTVKHYPNREIFYSAMRIVWTGDAWSVFGFTPEQTYFPYYEPAPNTSTVAVTVGETVVKESTSFSKTLSYARYGREFASKQELYDFILGYGKYLQEQGFIFEGVELGDVRNWQLSAKQFIFWSNDALQSGNYIDLNPAADGIVFELPAGQLENLAGTDENVGQIVDRMGKPLFSKDLLVSRDNPLSVRTKDATNPIYGVKFVFVTYESVVHLSGTSIFNDVFFQPEVATTKRSFVVGGKKSQAWDGSYKIPGYMFNGTDIIPNYDTMSDTGRALFEIENTLLDTTMLDASVAQFGLNRNQELRQLFLPHDREVLFKNAITFNKGTRNVFNSLDPLTHKDRTSSTKPFEEYMVRVGEIGNTKNIEYYEFILKAEDILKTTQIIKFTPTKGTNEKITYIKDTDKNRWIHRPFNKNMRFKTYVNRYSKVEGSSPLLGGDTDYSVASVTDLVHLYTEFDPIWSIPAYKTTQHYTKFEKVRVRGRVYEAISNVSPNTWDQNVSKFTQVPEPMLPNVYVEKYLVDPGYERTDVVKGDWQVLQTVDRELNIVEVCTGLTDTSRARVNTEIDHKLVKGDYVLIVNADGDFNTVNGIWEVDEVETIVDGDNEKYFFYIRTNITETILTGKVFTFLPVRFNDPDVINKFSEKPEYVFRDRYTDPTKPGEETPGGLKPKDPIIIVEDDGWKIYSVTTEVTLVKTEANPVNIDDIEHLLIYDYEKNRTLAKVELFDPKKLRFPQIFKDEIDTIGRVDPARYNRTTDEYKAVYSSNSWFEEFIGRRWWDTSTLRFADYENGDDFTKAKYWGTTVAGSSPDIYEWTKSPVPPSDWAKLIRNKGSAFGVKASGEAYVDTSTGSEQYHWVEEEDLIAGKVFKVYYFWVKNKDTVAKESKFSRIYSTNQLNKLILNPSAAGFAWWAPIGSDTIIVNGVQRYLNNYSTVVQIKKRLKGNEKHQQWMFISEGNELVTIPEWMHVRFRDSLGSMINADRKQNFTAYDENNTYTQSDFVKYNNEFYICKTETTGSFNANYWTKLTDVREVGPTTFEFTVSKIVPDLEHLHPFNLTGNSVRPYLQSWFLEVLEARRTFIKFVNKQLINVDLKYGISNWGTRLNQTAYPWGDTTVDMTAIWISTDYYSVDYDPTKSVLYMVDSRQEMQKLNARIGDYIRVLNQLDGTDTIYEVAEGNGYNAVYRKNGTIQFIDDLWKIPAAGGWDLKPWDNKPWDFDLNAQMSIIVDALRYDVYLGQYKVYYSNMMCAMLRYVLSEQINVDWVQKASTVEPLNLIGQTFNRPAELERDNISILTDFYGSVKSYRDKIRDSNVNKEILEPMDLKVTDSYVTTIIMDNVPEARLTNSDGTYKRDDNGKFIWVKDESRLAFGTDVEPDVTITGLNFVPTGWDDDVWDSLPLDPGQDEFNSKLQKVYNAYKGIPAVALQAVATGKSTGRFFHTPHGEEAIDMRIGDSLVIDTTLTEFNKTVRQHYYNNNVAAFILNDNVRLLHDVGYETTHIAFDNMHLVPEANAENPGFIWIGNELVIYFVKTATGISGLIRGAFGTPIGSMVVETLDNVQELSHVVGSPVSVVSADTVLYDYTHIQNVKGLEFFSDDLGVTIADSVNPLAMRIKD